MLTKRSVYVAGAMSGIEDFNTPAFTAAAKDLRVPERMAWLSTQLARAAGVQAGEKVPYGRWTVEAIVSPAELDADEGIDYDEVQTEPGSWQTQTDDYAEFLARDVWIVSHPLCLGVVVLPGWEDSNGAALEVHVARALNKPVLSYPDLEPVKRPTNVAPPSDENVTEEANRLVTSDRGEAYGHPFRDFGQTAGILSSLGFRRGERELGPADVPVMMIAVKLSRLASSPTHRDSYVDICGYSKTAEMLGERDPELVLR